MLIWQNIFFNPFNYVVDHKWTKNQKMVMKYIYYRPQRSWAKVIFSQASVCPQGGVCLSACWDIPPQQHHPPPSRHPPGADTPRTRYAPPGPDPPPGSRPPREADSSIRSTSGRYASYWNAFLFNKGWRFVQHKVWKIQIFQRKYPIIIILNEIHTLCRKRQFLHQICMLGRNWLSLPSNLRRLASALSVSLTVQ